MWYFIIYQESLQLKGRAKILTSLSNILLNSKSCDKITKHIFLNYYYTVK